MHRFSRVLMALSLVLISLNAAARAQSTPAEKDVVKLLQEFLNKVDDPAMHDRFWADDLIYTSGKGIKRSKADIMRSMRESKPEAPRNEAKETYGAEDITTHAFPGMVVLNFRLVQHVQQPGQPEQVHTFRNTGVFLQRNGKWQAVAWQATPEQKEAMKEEQKK